MCLRAMLPNVGAHNTIFSIKNYVVFFGWGLIKNCETIV